MLIKRWYGKTHHKISREVFNMATISFERNIELSPKAVKNLIKISNQPIRKELNNNIDIISELKKGDEILKQLFSH